MLQPFLTTPVYLLPSAPPNPFHGYIGGRSGPIGVSQFYAPVVIGSYLYACVQAVGSGAAFTPPGGIYMIRSADQGATWAVLDQANGPSTTEPDSLPGTAGMFFDGAHTVTVCWSPTADPLASPSPLLGAIQFQDFDTVSNTWGAVYGTAGTPSVFTVNQIFKRASGEIVVLYNDHAAGIHFEGLKAITWSAGTWGAPFAIDSGVTGPFISASFCSACMDSIGAVHVFGVANNTPTSIVDQEVFYQQITPTNTLGTFAIIEGGLGLGKLPAFVGQCCVFGNILAIGSVDASGNPVIITGTPLSSPTFSTFGSIDPGQVQNPAFGSFVAPVIGADATGFYAVYTPRTAGGNNIRVSTNPNVANPGSAGWTGITAYTQNPSGPFSPDAPGINVINGTVLLTYSPTASPGGGNQPTAVWAGNFPTPPTPPTHGASPAITGGLPYGLTSVALLGHGDSWFYATQGMGGHCVKPNLWYECLEFEALKFAKIKAAPSCLMPNGVDPFALFWADEGGYYPEQSSPILEVGSIVTPAPAAGLVPILSFRIPTGYDSILTGLALIYTGTGFEDGSGDILWYVQKSQRYLKGLAGLAYAIGDVDTPAPLTYGQPVQAGQVVTVYVSVPNLSGNIQVGASRIVAQVWGARWPRG